MLNANLRDYTFNYEFKGLQLNFTVYVNGYKFNAEWKGLKFVNYDIIAWMLDLHCYVQCLVVLLGCP